MTGNGEQQEGQFQEVQVVRVTRNSSGTKDELRKGLKESSKKVQLQLPKYNAPNFSGIFKGKMLRILIWVMGGILGTALLTGAYAGFVYYKWTQMTYQISTASANGGGTESVGPLADQFKQTKTFLLLGMDTRKQTGSLNTDVIMIGKVDPVTKTATVVSVPRDTLLQPGKHRWKANGYYANYFVNDRATVQDKIKETFSDYLNTKIDFVTTIDFKAFEEIIDSLGGLEINVDQDMRYTDNADGTHIDLKQGLQKLDGKNTLDFVRYRKSNDGTKASNDIERNERQSQVFRQLMDRLKSISGVLHIGDILDAISKNMTTDIPSDQMLPLIREYITFSKENIKFVHLVGEWKSPYIYVGDEELKKAQDALKAEH